MRLTCPNCDAQYEVPSDVVPVEGRDVQCSNCGQTWFQHHEDHMPEEDQGSSDADIITEDEENEAPDQTAEEPLGEAEDSFAGDGEEEEEASAPPVDAPARKEIDPAVAEILRAEAEAEQAARRAQSGDPLESQPDLGLNDADDRQEAAERRTLEARQRMARMRGEPEPMSEADINAAAISSRRDLLPDIDEINSTLRSENDRGAPAAGQAQIDGPDVKKTKGGFRRGLILMIVIFVLLALLYIYAPRIAQAVPQVDPYLSSYVAWVDQMRLWLDGKVQGMLTWLDTMASQSGSEGS